nr:glycosyltransferase family 87 protein [uncultured Lichenicoccus sp.]
MASSKPVRLRTGLVLTAVLLTLLFAALLVISLSEVHNDWSLGRGSPFGGGIPEQDLANLWMAGRIARLGHLDWLYTARLFEAWRNHAFGMALVPEPWIYPPTVLLIGIPLSFLSLIAAFLLWTAGSILVAVLALRHARLPWPILLVGLGAPATWRSLILGQYGVATGALVVAGLLLAPRQPVRAGILVGLCTLKPQQAVIVPVGWLAARNWRAIAAAAAVFAAMALAIAAWLGRQSWMLFLSQSRLSMRGILEAPLPQPYINTGVSVFWMAHTLGLGFPAAYAMQAISAISAGTLAYRAWRLPEADPLARMAVTVCLSLLVTPYGYTSDMVAYSLAVTTIAAGNGWRIRMIDGLLWLWPGYCPLVAEATGVVLTPVAVAATIALAWHHMVNAR